MPSTIASPVRRDRAVLTSRLRARVSSTWCRPESPRGSWQPSFIRLSGRSSSTMAARRAAPVAGSRRISHRAPPSSSRHTVGCQRADRLPISKTGARRWRVELVHLAAGNVTNNNVWRRWSQIRPSPRSALTRQRHTSIFIGRTIQRTDLVPAVLVGFFRGSSENRRSPLAG